MSVNPQAVKGILFDVYVTLSDTDDAYLRRLTPWVIPLAFILKRKPKALARDLIYWMESPTSYLFHLSDHLHLDQFIQQTFSVLDRLVSFNRPTEYILIEGITEMLQALKSEYTLAVVSARAERKTMAFLDHFELTSYFDIVVTGQTCQYTKPHPDPVLYAIKNLGLEPGQCLMVGDTTADILAGKAAGTQTIGVLCGFGKEAELRQAGADAILRQTGEITDWLSPIA